MSFSDNIEYLMAHPGTVAVLVTSTTDSSLIMRGNISWRMALGAVIDLMATSTEERASAVIGEHSILAETRDGQQCAVVYPTNTPAAKVMRRMLRNAAGPKRTWRKVSAPAATPSE